MKYSKPQISVFSASDIREFQAKAGSANCAPNTGNVCGTQVNICICVSFSCIIKK